MSVNPQMICFDNRLPLRTRQDIHEAWLSYAYMDFGGNYFRWCRCIKQEGNDHNHCPLAGCLSELNSARGGVSVPQKPLPRIAQKAHQPH